MLIQGDGEKEGQGVNAKHAKPSLAWSLGCRCAEPIKEVPHLLEMVTGYIYCGSLPQPDPKIYHLSADGITRCKRWDDIFGRTVCFCSLLFSVCRVTQPPITELRSAGECTTSAVSRGQHDISFYTSFCFSSCNLYYVPCSAGACSWLCKS